MLDSDSSSEDEDRNAMLREAVYDNSADLYRKENNTKRVNQDTAVLPSRRPDKEKVSSNEENVHFYPELTKGAKDFLAKKLEDHLESELDSKEACFHKSHERESPENSEGIRLFSNSDHFVTSIDPGIPEKQKPRRRKLSSSDSSSEDERLNEAAVSHDFILEQSREVIPSNITPADIVITNMKDDMNVNVNGETGDSKKKKKKKKKKIKTDEIT